MNNEILQGWKEKLPEFRQKTDDFYAGNLDKGSYKGYSGYFGSYAQKGGTHSMLRLRLPGGRLDANRLRLLAGMLRTHQVKRIHFTTCQTIQLHDLDRETLYALMEEALDAGIAIMGGGGDFLRNIMASPLSGVQVGECFDVMNYALAASDYAMTLIDAPKMPRKLKIAFSNSPENVTHATYRDLGFAANDDGTFDVYSAGGLGGFPKLGICVAEHVEPSEILYYIKAKWLLFCERGNYENRAKARTRYMQEQFESPQGYIDAFAEKLSEVMQSGEQLSVSVEASVTSGKLGDGSDVKDWRAIPQKQEGLFAVMYHPIGGQPDVETFLGLCTLLEHMEDVELRISPDETAYIINLTGSEAEQVLAAIDRDNARSVFETSVSCIGASTCQVGVRDSQALLRSCVKALRVGNLPADALPKIHISGCPSSCGTHQTSSIGFRGGMKLVDGKPQSAFVLNVGGCEYQGKESLGGEIGAMLESDIPDFFVEVGEKVAADGLSFETWYETHKEEFLTIAGKYIGI
jgi:ferredoxin-nitrite reductase